MEIIVIVFIVWFVIVITLLLVSMANRDVRRHSTTLLYQFSKVGSKYGLSFTSQEILPHRIIGIDGIQQTILVFEIMENDFDWYLIKIRNVKACTLKKIYGSMDVTDSEQGSPDRSLEMIALEFSYKEGKQTVVLPFYLKLQDNLGALPELKQKAKNWEVMLNKMLTREIKEV